MLKYLFCTVSLSLVFSTAAAGPIVDVEGRRYEIDSVTGLLSAHRTTITSQIWFGKSGLARTFANKLGNAYGTPNYNLYGPMFGYYIYEGPGVDYTTGWVYNPSRFQIPADDRAQANNATVGNYYTYATARDLGAIEVPEPPNLMLLGLGTLLLMALRDTVAGRLSSHPRGLQRVSPTRSSEVGRKPCGNCRPC